MTFLNSPANKLCVGRRIPFASTVILSEVKRSGTQRRIPCVQKPALQRDLFWGVVLLSGDSSLRYAPFRMTVVLLCIGVMFLIPLMGGVRGGFSFAQGERKHIREGNKQYEKNKYEDAEISYRNALDKNEKSYEGAFNLGDAFYKRGKYEDAANRFDMLTHQESDKNTTAKAYHNLGNSLLQSKKYEESIKAYKNALRNNPRDLDTKYNLAYAQAKLKQLQEQSKQDQNQENKEQDQKQQGEDKSQQKEQDNKKEQNKGGEKEQEQTQQKEQQQQPRPDQISKKDAERLLDAINNEEKDIQEKLKKKKARVTKIKIEKDW